MTAPEVVAVVVPAHNASEYLAETITAILGQRDVTVDCVVVDDGSDDDTAGQAEAFPGVRVLRTPNNGVSSARNLGARATTSPLIAFCDADDVWHPDKLRRQLDLLRSNPRSPVAYCSYELHDGQRVIGRVAAPDVDRALRDWACLEGNGLLLSSTAVIRREVFEGLGGFDVSLSCSADLDLALRLRERGEPVMEEAALVRYRMHPMQMHRKPAEQERDHPRVAARIADDRLRQRAIANLSAHLAAQALRRFDLGSAARHSARALRDHPASLVRIPFAIARRRARRRVAALRSTR